MQQHLAKLRKELKQIVEQKSINLKRLKNSLQHVTKVERCEAVQSVLGDYNATALHRLAKDGDNMITRHLLEELSPDQIYHLINLRDIGGVTALHYAAWQGNVLTVKCLFKKLTSEQKYTLLQIRGVEAFTALHCAVLKDNVDTIKCLVEPLSASQKCNLLRLKDSIGHDRAGGGMTAVQYSARDGNEAIVECFFRFLSKDEKSDLLRMQNADGDTGMHMAARYGHTNIIRCMLSDLTWQKQHGLLHMQNYGHLTALNMATRQHHVETAAHLQECITSCFAASRLKEIVQIHEDKIRDLEVKVGNLETEILGLKSPISAQDVDSPRDSIAVEVADQLVW